MLQQVRGLLVPLDAVRERQDDVVSGRRGEPELAVRVLADLRAPRSARARRAGGSSPIDPTQYGEKQ